MKRKSDVDRLAEYLNGWLCPDDPIDNKVWRDDARKILRLTRRGWRKRGKVLRRGWASAASDYRHVWNPKPESTCDMVPVNVVERKA